jgi:hypothetical protein
VSDPGTLVAILAAAVVALAMVSLAALKGWDGWLELRRLELTQGKGTEPKSPAAARLELADLKDRVRRLEAIANGDEDAPPQRRAG